METFLSIVVIMGVLYLIIEYMLRLLGTEVVEIDRVADFNRMVNEFIRFRYYYLTVDGITFTKETEVDYLIVIWENLVKENLIVLPQRATQDEVLASVEQ